MALVNHGYSEDGAKPNTTIELACRGGYVLSVDVGSMDQLSINERTRRKRFAVWCLWEEFGSLACGSRPWIVLCNEMKQLAVVAGDNGVLASAQFAGAPNDGVKHGLHIGRRTGDHAKNLASGRLL